jgi:hypothetical protein
MPRAHAVEYEARGDGDAVLCIHGAIIADSFAPLMDERALAAPPGPIEWAHRDVQARTIL